MKKQLHRDVYAGIALTIFCAAVFSLALDIQSGANYLPLGLSAFMGVMSVMILVGGIKETKNADSEHPFKYDTTWNDMKKPIIVYMIVTAYFFAFQIFGYFTATPIFLIVLQKYLKAGSWKRILIVTLGYMIFTYVLFVSILSLPIYRVGIFGKFFRF